MTPDCLIEELDDAQAVQKAYIWGLDLSQMRQGAGGVGGLLAAFDDTVTYLYNYDGNGNVGQVVNLTDGSIGAHYEYDPYGKLVDQSGVYADENVYRFSTKYYDSEYGLYYYGYRYYCSDLGRWLTGDPIEEAGGINIYAFVINNSINWTDRLGLKWICGSGCRWVEGDELKALEYEKKKQLDGYRSKQKIKFEEMSRNVESYKRQLEALEREESIPPILKIFQPTDFSKIERDFNAEYFGWELHILVGGGRLHLSCCDGENIRHHHYSKVCLGAAIELGVSGGCVFNSDGESCKNAPVNLIGAELGFGLGPILGLEGGATVDMAGEAGVSTSVGGGPGRALGVGIKATACYYRLNSSEKTNKCCSLNKGK